MFWLEQEQIWKSIPGPSLLSPVHPNSAQFGGTKARWKGKSVQYDVNQPQGLLSI